MRKDVLGESQCGGVVKKENTLESLQCAVDENIVVKEELAIDESDICTSIENDIFVTDSNATPSDISTGIKEEFIFCDSTSASNMEELFLEMSCQKHFIDEVFCTIKTQTIFLTSLHKNFITGTFCIAVLYLVANLNDFCVVINCILKLNGPLITLNVQ